MSWHLLIPLLYPKQQLCHQTSPTLPQLTLSEQPTSDRKIPQLKCPLYIFILHFNLSKSLHGKFFLTSRAQWEKVGQISFCPLIFFFPYTYASFVAITARNLFRQNSTHSKYSKCYFEMFCRTIITVMFHTNR
jgi:hypothetical protein